MLRLFWEGIWIFIIGFKGLGYGILVWGGGEGMGGMGEEGGFV